VNPASPTLRGLLYRIEAALEYAAAGDTLAARGVLEDLQAELEHELRGVERESAT
jgi:hypothetical protein